MTQNYSKLFDLLEKKKITRTELVESELISPGTLVRLRKNKQVSMFTLEKICAYIDCDIFDIFSITEDRSDDKVEQRL